MYRLTGITVCIFLLGALTIKTGNGLGSAQTIKNNRWVESAKSRPDLSVKFDSVAQLKIAVRKSTFHIGEMIDLNIAVLNSSKKGVFFPLMLDPQIDVQSPSDESVKVRLYGTAERTMVPSSFTLLAPSEADTASFQLLAGCDRRAFSKSNSADNDRIAFDENLFVNWGRACLSLTRPGTYVLTAEIHNDYVIVSRRHEDTKSAVGKIRSNPLTITIVD